MAATAVIVASTVEPQAYHAPSPARDGMQLVSRDGEGKQSVVVRPMPAFTTKNAATGAEVKIDYDDRALSMMQLTPFVPPAMPISSQMRGAYGLVREAIGRGRKTLETLQSKHNKDFYLHWQPVPPGYVMRDPATGKLNPNPNFRIEVKTISPFGKTLVRIKVYCMNTRAIEKTDYATGKVCFEPSVIELKSVLQPYMITAPKTYLGASITRFKHKITFEGAPLSMDPSLAIEWNGCQNRRRFPGMCSQFRDLQQLYQTLTEQATLALAQKRDKSPIAKVAMRLNAQSTDQEVYDMYLQLMNDVAAGFPVLSYPPEWEKTPTGFVKREGTSSEFFPVITNTFPMSRGKMLFNKEMMKQLLSALGVQAEKQYAPGVVREFYKAIGKEYLSPQAWQLTLTEERGKSKPRECVFGRGPMLCDEALMCIGDNWVLAVRAAFIVKPIEFDASKPNKPQLSVESEIKSIDVVGNVTDMNLGSSIGYPAIGISTTAPVLEDDILDLIPGALRQVIEHSGAAKQSFVTIGRLKPDNEPLIEEAEDDLTDQDWRDLADRVDSAQKARVLTATAGGAGTDSAEAKAKRAAESVQMSDEPQAKKRHDEGETGAETVKVAVVVLPAHGTQDDSPMRELEDEVEEPVEDL